MLVCGSMEKDLSRNHSIGLCFALLRPIDTISPSAGTEPNDGSVPNTSSSPCVQFSEPDVNKNQNTPYPSSMSLNSDQHSLPSPSPSDSTSELSLSGSSTPSVVESQNSTGPIAKVLASRLSFWSSRQISCARTTFSRCVSGR